VHIKTDKFPANQISGSQIDQTSAPLHLFSAIFWWIPESKKGRSGDMVEPFFF
jgi:hypothetical protein